MFSKGIKRDHFEVMGLWVSCYYVAKHWKGLLQGQGILWKLHAEDVVFNKIGEPHPVPYKNNRSKFFTTFFKIVRP